MKTTLPAPDLSDEKILRYVCGIRPCRKGGLKLETDHDTTPDGLDYVARTMIVVPDKGVEMTVENFSYKRER